MSIEKEKISGLQLIFLLTGFIQGSILLISFIVNLAKHDFIWVALSGLAATIPFVLIYTSLARMFPCMNLIQINEAVYGAYLGKVVSMLYIIYFFMVLTFNIRILVDFYMTFLMADTPMIFFLAAFTLVCAYTVWKGIEVMAHVSHLFVAAGFFVIVSTFLLLLRNMNFSNFLPIFELSWKNFLHGTHIIAAIPFGEIFIFLTFATALKHTKHITKNVLLGLLLGAIGFIIVAVRDTAVLGNTGTIWTSPSFNSTQLINIGNILTRMDLLIGIVITTAIFIKCSVLYYSTVVSISHFLQLNTYLPLVLPIGGIAIIISITDWQSSVEFTKVSPSVAPIFITPFLFILPPLTFLIAKIRNIPKRKRRKEE